MRDVAAQEKLAELYLTKAHLCVLISRMLKV